MASLVLAVIADLVIAFVLVRLGSSLSDAVVAAVIPVWFLFFYSRTLIGLSIVTFEVVSLRWLRFLFWLLLLGLVALVSKAVQRGNGPVIAAAVAVFGVASIAQHAHALIAPPSVQPAPASFTITEEKNVWVLVFDELASPLFLGRYTTDPPQIVKMLENQGFEVPLAPVSPYSQTYPALTSIFTLDPVRPGIYGEDDWAARSAVFGGDHPLARSYVDEGRPVVLVEAPISPGYCSDIVTDCHPALLDDFDRFLIANTALFELPGSWRSWAEQGLAQMDRLDEVAQEGGTGRLILAHVMLAHGPYLLDSACNTSLPSVYSSEKYMDQVGCLGSRLSKLVSVIPPDDVVLILSDHGITRAEPYPMDTPEAREERLVSFVALRGCQPSDEYLDSNVNAYRALVNCVTTASLEPVVVPPTLTCYLGKDTIELVEIPKGVPTDPVECREGSRNVGS